MLNDALMTHVNVGLATHPADLIDDRWSKAAEDTGVFLRMEFECGRKKSFARGALRFTEIIDREPDGHGRAESQDKEDGTGRCRQGRTTGWAKTDKVK